MSVNIRPDRAVAIDIATVTAVGERGTGARDDDQRLLSAPGLLLGERMPEVLVVGLGKTLGIPGRDAERKSHKEISKMTMATRGTRGEILKDEFFDLESLCTKINDDTVTDSCCPKIAEYLSNMNSSEGFTCFDF